VNVEPGIAESDLVNLALAQPKVSPLVAGKPLKRTIYIKGRIINLLV
jgi:leucyl-tRNA synthetase